MSYDTKDVTQGGRRPVGWFSRRHQTRDAQDQARIDYLAKHPSKKLHKKRR